MPLLGAQQSIAGGLHRALERGRKAGCEAVQLFTRSSRQWAARPLGEDDVRAFAAARAASGIRAVLAHDCYLFNLASPDETLRRRSTRALIDELERCARLGIPYLVTHPGAHCGAGEAAGLGAAARSLGESLGACRGYPATIALENTAGQGTQIGVRFDQLARLVAETPDGDRLRVCLDTQHAFAAGYDLRSAEGYAAMVAELERTVGVERLVAFHLNDAKKGLGSRVDRHEHIGRGELGPGAFRRLLRDPRFRDLPMCLETPKTPDPDDHCDDRRNLAVLRKLLA
ncbi:MAG: deoxyribonuclease IV [Deltaproteobacteria bacterium]|nr:MAG: deoxyribonuclease IV [Deltaproteobacteria bacterium]